MHASFVHSAGMLPVPRLLRHDFGRRPHSTRVKPSASTLCVPLPHSLKGPRRKVKSAKAEAGRTFARNPFSAGEDVKQEKAQSSKAAVLTSRGPRSSGPDGH